MESAVLMDEDGCENVPPFGLEEYGDDVIDCTQSCVDGWIKSCAFGEKAVDRMAISIDLGNHNFKGNFSYLRGGIDALADRVPYSRTTNYYRDGQSTIFISYSVLDGAVERMARAGEYSKYMGISGFNVVEVSADELALDLNFSERTDSGMRIMRCLKSQYYGMFVRGESKFDNAILEIETDDGCCCRYFVLREIGREEVRAMTGGAQWKPVKAVINANELMDALYREIVLEMMRFAMVHLSGSCRDFQPSDELRIEVVSTIPIGCTNEIANDFGKVEEYLSKALKCVFYYTESTMFGRQVVLSSQEGSGTEQRVIRTGLSFRTKYESYPIVRHAMDAAASSGRKVACLAKDVGSFTEQTLLVEIDGAARTMRYVIADSRYRGGLFLNEMIVSRYFSEEGLDASDYFFKNGNAMYTNMKRLENIKKSILLGHGMPTNEAFLSSSGKPHAVSEARMLRIVPEEYRKFIEGIWLPREIFSDDQGCDRYIALNGGSLNMKAGALGESYTKYLRGVVGGGVKVQPCADENFLAKNMDTGWEDLSAGVFTMYDAIMIGSCFQGIRRSDTPYVILRSGSVKRGRTDTLEVRPCVHDGVGYVYVFGCADATGGIVHDAIVRGGARVMTGHTEALRIRTRGELTKLMKSRPGSFGRIPGVYMIPFFKIAIAGVERGSAVTLRIDLSDTFGLGMRVTSMGKTMVECFGVYPIVTSNLRMRMKRYDFFKGTCASFEKVMFHSVGCSVPDKSNFVTMKCFGGAGTAMCEPSNTESEARFIGEHCGDKRKRSEDEENPKKRRKIAH